ncbi:Uncharacterised protein [uncultured archaeon]|nr:Uncharacterised protein [uncultured archaeon]
MPDSYKQISIDKYTVSHNLFPKASSIAGKVLFRNYISLYSSGSYVGYIGFWPDDPEDIFPKSKVETVSPFKFSLFYYFARYQDIIDTLRYEKPITVSISWDADNNIKSASIYTGTEPVGEQEGRGAPST